MFFHSQKAVALARRRVVLARKTESWNTHAFHSSHWRREQYLDASQKTFDDVALNRDASNKAVLVDFYADWCGPCKMISPILERLTGDSNIRTGSGRSLDLVTVDTEKELELTHKYQIRALPTVIAFKDGEPVRQFLGARSEGDIIKFLEEL